MGSDHCPIWATVRLAQSYLSPTEPKALPALCTIHRPDFCLEQGCMDSFLILLEPAAVPRVAAEMDTPLCTPRYCPSRKRKPENSLSNARKLKQTSLCGKGMQILRGIAKGNGIQEVFERERDWTCHLCTLINLRHAQRYCTSKMLSIRFQFFCCFSVGVRPVMLDPPLPPKRRNALRTRSGSHSCFAAQTNL